MWVNKKKKKEEQGERGGEQSKKEEIKGRAKEVVKGGAGWAGHEKP